MTPRFICALLVLVPVSSINIITCNIHTLWISTPVSRQYALEVITANSGSEAAKIELSNSTTHPGTAVMQIEFDDFTDCYNPTTKLHLGGFRESSVQFSFGSNPTVKGCDTHPGCNLQMFAFTNDFVGAVGMRSVGGRFKKTADMEFVAGSMSGTASSGSGGLGMNASWTGASPWMTGSNISGEDWAAMHNVKLQNEMCCEQGLLGKEKCDCSAQTFGFGETIQIRRINGTANIGALFVAEVQKMEEQRVVLGAPEVLAFEARTTYSAGLSC